MQLDFKQTQPANNVATTLVPLVPAKKRPFKPRMYIRNYISQPSIRYNTAKPSHNPLMGTNTHYKIKENIE